MQKEICSSLIGRKTSVTALLTLTLLAITGCNSSGSNPLITNPKNPLGLGPAPVSLSSNGAATVDPGDLGSAGNYVILAKTGVSNVFPSAIVGNIGVSPIFASGITGFPLTAAGPYSTTPEVNGKLYAPDYSVPTPSNLTTAISNMETAYTNAAGRTSPDYVELHAGDLGGKTLTPGLYKWSSSVIIPTTVTLSGSATDVWIFQIAGDVTMSSATAINLLGGALPKNIFWQVAGQVIIGSTAVFRGIILCQTQITFDTGSKLFGRAYAQSAVVLRQNDITQP